MLRATRVHLEFGWNLEYGAITLYGRTFQFFSSIPIRSSFLNPTNSRCETISCSVLQLGGKSRCPTTPTGMPAGLGSSAFARRYLRNLFDFFSTGYLDVSVHPVPSSQPMYSAVGAKILLLTGFPIRKSSDYRIRAAPRGVSSLARPSSATCP